MAGTAHLKKYSQTFYKDKSGSDLAQIPASSISINVYKQGATVASGVTVTTAVGGVAVSVRSVGHIVLNDTVQLGTDATKQMMVEEVTSSISIKLRSTIGANIVLAAGDRLVIYSTVPALYNESTGVSTMSNPATTSTAGYVEFYTPEARFDVLASGAGITTQLFIDNESGWVKDGVAWINAKNYATIQAAVDALPSTGGVTFVPAGTYTPTSVPIFNGITLAANTELIGEGREATKFVLNAAGSENVDAIILSAGGCTIKNIVIQGRGIAGTGIGIKSAIASTNINIYDCVIFNTPSWGISLTSASSLFTNRIVNTTVYQAISGGSLLVGQAGVPNTTLWCSKSIFNGPGFTTYGNAPVDRGAVHIITGSSISFNQCSFHVPDGSTAFSLQTAPRDIALNNCYFESNTNAPNPGGFFITATGFSSGPLVLNGCHFLRTSTTVGPRVFKSDTLSSITTLMIGCSVSSSESSRNTDDVVLSNASDTFIASTNIVSAAPALTQVELAITDRAGVGFLNSGFPAWQLKIPSTTATSVVTRPVSGSIIWDSSAAVGQKLKVYDGGWRIVTTT